MLAQLPQPILHIMKEDRLFAPSKQFASQARISSVAEYQRLWNEAATDPEGFWGKLASELHWFRPYTEVLRWREPIAEWFTGGLTNVAYNCLDIHLNGPRRDKVAMVWEGEPGDTRILTYQMLHGEVCKFANVLKSLGIQRGDVVSIISHQREQSGQSGAPSYMKTVAPAASGP